MACAVIASPDSASTLAAASRALSFLGLASLGVLFALVVAGLGGSLTGSVVALVPSGWAVWGAVCGPVASVGGVSGAGTTNAPGGASVAEGVSGGPCGSGTDGVWASTASGGV